MSEVNGGLSFTLGVGEVPEIPASPLWVDQLRWMLMVMDYDDPALPFIAGCFQHAITYGGALSDKQHLVCQRHIARVKAEYDAGTLVCQCVQTGSEANG